MEAKKNSLTVCKGEYFEISMLSNAGSTGYSWCISALDGAILFWGDEDQAASSKMIGASHKKIYRFIAQDVGDAKVVFQLVRPWLPSEVLVQNEYDIHVEASNSHDELKKYIDEDSFPKKPVLKYGFIMTKPAMPYGVLNTEVGASNKNLGMVQVQEQDPRCTLKYGFPVPDYGFPTTGGEACLLKYGFMADTSQIK